jgi:hypothetical protein
MLMESEHNIAREDKAESGPVKEVNVAGSPD